MKTLELEKIGVQGMSPEQLKRKNGGFIIAAIVGYILIEALLNPSAHIQAFSEGMEMVKDPK